MVNSCEFMDRYHITCRADSSIAESSCKYRSRSHLAVVVEPVGRR